MGISSRRKPRPAFAPARRASTRMRCAIRAAGDRLPDLAALLPPNRSMLRVIRYLPEELDVRRRDPCGGMAARDRSLVPLVARIRRRRGRSALRRRLHLPCGAGPCRPEPRALPPTSRPATSRCVAASWGTLAVVAAVSIGAARRARAREPSDERCRAAAHHLRNPVPPRARLPARSTRERPRAATSLPGAVSFSTIAASRTASPNSSRASAMRASATTQTTRGSASRPIGTAASISPRPSS